MGKKKADKDSERYEYVRVSVDPDGNMRMDYKLNGNATPGWQSHDEDVSGWSDAEIRRIVRDLLLVEKDDPVKVVVHHN